MPQIIWHYDPRGSQPCLLIEGGRTIKGPQHAAHLPCKTADQWEQRLWEQYACRKGGEKHNLIEDGPILHCPALA